MSVPRWVCPACGVNNMPESPACFRCGVLRPVLPPPRHPSGWRPHAWKVALAFLIPLALFYSMRYRGPLRPRSSSIITHPGGWTEETTTQEQPEIRVSRPYDSDLSGYRAWMVFQGPGGTHRLECPTGESSLTLPAGEYSYGLYAVNYTTTGAPDQAGTLTCRRYRAYRLMLGRVTGRSGTDYRDLGDER